MSDADSIGREAERRRVAGLLTSVAHDPDGPAVDDRFIVLRGPAGIGKTWLLRHAAASALELGFTVHSCGGQQRDQSVPLAGLEELLGPEFVAAFADRRPDPSQVHLPAAMVALRIVLAWAQSGPVLLVVDDLQWLDSPSWEALLFVLRRLRHDPVVALLAATSGADGDDRLRGTGLPEITLGPLGNADAADLVHRTAPELPVAVAEIVLREAAGLPLALVELSTAASQDGDHVLAGALPISDRLERTFVRALHGLPELTRTVLQVLSVGDSTSTADVLAATRAHLGAAVELAAVQPAVDARLAEVSVDGFEIRFATPTARAVVHQLTDPGERHRIHLAWATALAADPDRAIWHRAAGTLGPDPELLDDLVALAERATGRDALAMASVAHEQAARFAAHPRQAAHLVLLAALDCYESGDSARGRRLLASMDVGDLTPVDRARARWLHGLFDEEWFGASSLPYFIDAARQMHDQRDDVLALRAIDGVSLRFYFTNPETAVREQAVDLLDALDLPADAMLLRAGAYALVAPVQRGRRALADMAGQPAATVPDTETLVSLGMGALGLGDQVSSREYLTEAETRCRLHGRLGTLARTLVTSAFASALAGQTDAARAQGTEGRELAVETGQGPWVVCADLALGYAAALRGEADQAARLAADAEATLLSGALRPLLSYVELIRGITASAAGDSESALRHLLRPFREEDDVFHPQVRFWGLSHLAVAALRCGRGDVLDDVVAVARAEHARTGSPVLTAGLAHVDAIRAPDADAPARFEWAISTLGTDWPFDRARVKLAYAGWLRRHRRGALARRHLEEAASTCDALGVQPWARSARRKLGAHAAPYRAPSSPVDILSPQEFQVAELVSEGLTNRQIAERLFLSPRTVETHLYRIYPKIGATNRTDLARILNAGAQVT